jgi:hypothetical protein
MGYFEIGGKIVLFVKVNKLEDEKKAALYRVTINAKTAKIESEEIIEKLERPSQTGSKPIYGMMDIPHIFVVKDPESDCYGVVKYLHQKKNPEGCNFEIVHYSGDHKVINRVKYDYIFDKYAYARPIDYYVDGDKSIILVSSAFNSEKGGDKDVTAFISKIEKGKPVIHKELSYSENMKIKKCVFRKSSDYNALEILAYTLVNGSSYQLIFQPIGLEKIDIYKPYYLPYEKMDQYVKEKIGESDGYKGGFIERFIVDDQSNNLVSMKKNVTSFEDDYASSSNPELIGISYFDVNGKELNGWAYPYNAPFKEFLVFTNKAGKFILLNEDQRNFKKPLNEKHVPCKKVDESNTVLLCLKDNGEITQQYVFGEPKDKKESKRLAMDKIYYDSKTNTVIGYYYEGEGYKEKKLCFLTIE